MGTNATGAPATGERERSGAAPGGGERDTAAVRLPLLDVLRGLAVLGTLATNIWLFTGPGAEAGVLFGAGGISPAQALQDGGAGGAAEALFRFAANGTSLSLLTLLFGAGLAIQYRSAEKRGQRWPGPYKWRALFLFAEGLVHFTLVFAWDVLMGYAVTAITAAWLLTRSRRTRALVAAAAGALHVALMGALTALLAVFAPQAVGGADVPGELVRLYAEGSYADQVAFRLEAALLLRMEPVLVFFLLLVLFLTGVALFRAGAFAPGSAGRRLRIRMAAWGLGAGLPLKTAAVLAGADYFLLDRYVAAPVVAIGAAGLIGLLHERTGGTGPLTSAVSSLGRTALSGYVLQNVLAMLLCYGFGLGLATRFGDSGPWWVLALWAAISAVLLASAALWLRRFRSGPLEAVQKAVLGRIGARRPPRM